MRVRFMLGASALSFALALAFPALASDETEALRARIRALEARLDALERKESGAPLEERVATVERIAGDVKAKAEKTPIIEVGNGEGIAVTSPNGQYALRLRAYAQADTRTFFDNAPPSNVDTFLIRTARPILDAKITDLFTARLAIDFGNGVTRVPDAYIDAKLWPELNLRLGKFKVPVGLERAQSEQDILFVERGMPTNLVPSRDIGAMLHGELIPSQIGYQLAFTTGAAALEDRNGDADNHKDVSARVFMHPFRGAGPQWLSGLGAGVGGTYGQHTGSAASSNLTTGYVSPAQTRFFTYAAGAFADGATWRVNPQAYYYNGPVSLISEYVLESQEIGRAASRRQLKNDAWMAVAGYVLTGEDASFNGVKPGNDFDPWKGQWGAVEALARYGVLRVDADTYPLFANLASSAKAARETTLGATWYLNPSLKFNLNYSLTAFDGGAAGGLDREDEKVLMSRAQFKF